MIISFDSIKSKVLKCKKRKQLEETSKVGRMMTKKLLYNDSVTLPHLRRKGTSKKRARNIMGLQTFIKDKLKPKRNMTILRSTSTYINLSLTIKHY